MFRAMLVSAVPPLIDSGRGRFAVPASALRSGDGYAPIALHIPLNRFTPHPGMSQVVVFQKLFPQKRPVNYFGVGVSSILPTKKGFP